MNVSAKHIFDLYKIDEDLIGIPLSKHINYQKSSPRQQIWVVRIYRLNIILEILEFNKKYNSV